MTDNPQIILKKTWLSQKPQATAFAVAALSVFFIAVVSLLSWYHLFGISESLIASKQSLWIDHQFWRAWTSTWLHADERHLLSNSFLLFVLGYFLNGYFGFFVFPLSAFFFGGIINLILLKSAPLNLEVIGASGIVYWMGGAWLTLYFALERKRSLLQRFLRVGGVALLLFMPAEAFDPSISYGSHVTGFILGVLFAVVYFRIRRSFFRSHEIFEKIQDPENITCPNIDTDNNCPSSPNLSS